MSVTHLQSPDGSMCGRAGRLCIVRSDLTDVTCKNCLARLDRLTEAGEELAAERRFLRRNRDAAYAVGFGNAWEFVTASDTTPTTQLIGNLLGAVATYLIESGFAATPELRSSA